VDAGEQHRRVLRGIVALAVLALPVVFLRPAHNPFSVPKGLLGWLLAAAALAVTVSAAGTTRRITVGRRPVLAVLALFAVALMSATVPEASALRAVAGDYTRQAGLLAYACAAVLMGVTAAALRPDRADSELVGDHPVAGLLRTLLVAMVPVGGYGALQALGADPLVWSQRAGAPTVISTFGNANFLAGWLAIAGTATLWGAVTRTWGTSWRIGCGVLALVAFAVTLATTSAQGPAAWLAGCAVLAAVRLTDRERPLRPRPRRLLPVVLGASLVAGLAIGVAGGTAVVDDASASVAASYRDRTSLWATAASMGAEHLQSGVGIDAFADHYHRHRPLERAARYDTVRPAGNQAHNVALQLFAGGGAPALLGWLAWVGVVAAIGIRGLGRLAGERRLLLGGVLAAWAAYLTQSMVSIDVPALLGPGWILAGGVLAAAPPGRTSTWRLPRLAGPLSVLLAVAVLVASLVPAVRFLRADLALGTATRTPVPEVAEAQGNLALGLASWEPAYPMALGRHVLTLGEDRWAIALFDEALRRNPQLVVAHLDRARVARAIGLTDEAAAGYRRLVELVPTTPGVLEEAAAALEEAGDEGEAAELRDRAAALRARVGD
jgi:O-antigen ligase